MFQNNFTSGELSKTLWRRYDLAQHQNGCALARNLIPQIEGPLRKRAGFWFNGFTQDQSTRSRAVEYVRALDDAYLIELSHLKARIWGADGQLIRVAGTPIEITTTFSEADLAGLRWKQLGNVILFFHKDGRRPTRLQKVSETAWNFSPYAFENGPWEAENGNTGISLTCSNYEGSITVTATGYSFSPSQVGSKMRLRASTGSPGFGTWEAGKSVTAGLLKISNGRAYTAHASGTTGNTPPSHDIGRKSDGGVEWNYFHDNSGEFLITAYHSPSSVDATVIRILPTEGDATNHVTGTTPFTTFSFAEELYTDAKGWPTAWPELREERLIVGGGGVAPDKYNASQAAGYYGDRALFSPGLGSGTVLDDDAIQGFVGDDSFKAMWFVSGPLMIAGTHGGEAVIVGETAEAALRPSNAKPRALSRFGSADVRPIKAQESVVHVARGGFSLRDRAVSAFDYPGRSSDLSFIASHIAKRRFVEVAYCAAPDYVLWARLADNQPAAMLYNDEQNIKGWAQQALGGAFEVESMGVLPDVTGQDRLWLFVRRTKGGNDQRLVLMASVPDDLLRLDAAQRYFGAETDEVSGIAPHLEGEMVDVMIGSGDGRFASAGQVAVTGGVITLPTGLRASEIIWGLAPATRFESLPVIAAEQGAKKRIGAITVAYEGVSLSAGLVGTERDSVESGRDYGDTDALTVRERVITLPVDSDHENDPRVYIQCQDGFDLTIKSIGTTYADY